MIVPASRRFAWIVTIIGLFLTFAALFIGYRTNNYSYTGVIGEWYIPLIDVTPSFAALLIGGIISIRIPKNVYGWIWVLMGLGTGVIQSFASMAANWAISGNPPRTMIAGFAMYCSLLGWLLTVSMLVLSLLLFPTGRLPSPKWRWMVWMIFSIAIAESVFAWAIPGQSGISSIPNPIGQENLFGKVAEVVSYGGVGGILFIAFPLSVLSLFIRYRQGIVLQRVQIRWLAFAGLFNILALMIDSTNIHQPWVSEQAMSNISTLLVAALPLSVAVAILRYRLYDIDLIIRRTLQYGLLSVILGGVYYVLVVLFGQLVQDVTGQASPVVIVVSTLVIAALFNPLRHRTQQILDRRFFRQRYDADRTLESFSSVARQETDLERLSTELVGTVQQSIQPESVALWIRPGPANNVRRKA
jgi:hypothetical protein